MKIFLMAFLLSTFMFFETLENGESITLNSGVEFVSIQCVDCDIVHGGDTINISGSFLFPDYPMESYDTIRVISNSNNTKIAYRYEKY